jgi:hypothetical protein
VCGKRGPHFWRRTTIKLVGDECVNKVTLITLCDGDGDGDGGGDGDGDGR